MKLTVFGDSMSAASISTPVSASFANLRYSSSFYEGEKKYLNWIQFRWIRDKKKIKITTFEFLGCESVSSSVI